MNPLIAGSLIGVAGNALGNLLGFSSQSATNKANMKLAEYQFDRNVDMWNMANEYNAPKAQIQRLREAGLNPALMYGGGSAAGTAADTPTFDAPKLQAYTNFGDLGTSESILAASQAQKNLSDAANADSNAAYQNRSRELLDINEKLLRLEVIERTLKNKMLSSDVRVALKTEQNRIAKSLADLLLVQSQTTANEAVADKEAAIAEGYDIENKFNKEANPLRIKGIELDNENKEKQGKVLDSQAAANLASAVRDYAAARESNAHADLYGEQAKTERQMRNKLARKVSAETTLTYTQSLNKILEFEKLYQDIEKGRLTLEQAKYRFDAGVNIEDRSYVDALFNYLITSRKRLLEKGYNFITGGE